MATTDHVRCEIRLQKGKCFQAEFSRNTAGFSEEGFHIQVTEKTEEGCQYGKISLRIKNEAFTENVNLAMEHPVKVWIPMEKPEKMTAMYLYNPWWTRPAFIEHFQDIPDRTQTLFLKYETRVVCLILPAGEVFKTYLTGGTEREICIEMTAGLGGQNFVEELLYVCAEAPSVYEAAQKAVSWLADYKGIRMRGERRIPEMFRYLGWCSWDAFYREVRADGILQKAEELAEKKVPVKWMLIDDGWMTSQEELLADFVPDEAKFPGGFRKLTADIKSRTEIRWFGVWHALAGYWAGIAPGSSLAIMEQSYLYQAVSGRLLPSPSTGERFYRDWYEVLNREGIDFVKVDGQSSVPFYFENSLPVCEAARGMNQALESGASRMDGAVINCMGMAMENILARPATAISRNSDDFFPDKEESFVEHLLQNAYNSLYHNELYCCDWDMFWTMHKDAMKHSLLRAVSGGPVYTSDKPGATDPEILKPLTYLDGEVLMMDRSAKPAEDCIFSNPLTHGVLKLHNIASYGDLKAGGIAAFNLTDKTQVLSFCPADIPDLPVTDAYWVYDYFGKTAFLLGRNEKHQDRMEREAYRWFAILPCGKNGSCLGLLDKYVGFMAVESICESDNSVTVVLRESGTIGWISQKKPSRILVNQRNVTDQLEQEGDICRIRIPEDSSKMICMFLWE